MEICVLDVRRWDVGYKCCEGRKTVESSDQLSMTLEIACQCIS